MRLIKIRAASKIFCHLIELWVIKLIQFTLNKLRFIVTMDLLLVSMLHKSKIMKTLLRKFKFKMAASYIKMNKIMEIKNYRV